MLFNLNIDYSKRVFGLDVLRALAIMDVVIIHSSFVLGNIKTGFPWIRLIPGVTLFFVLSGFLIGSMLISIFEKKEVTLPVIFKFLKRRWFRTLPNYYLILFVNIIIVYFGIIKEDFSQFNFSFFIFCQNLLHPFHGFFWESWSITIEEWFYLSFPLCVAFIYWLTFSRRVKWIFFTAIIIYLVFPLFLRILQIDNRSLWNGNKIQGTVIYGLDAIAYGILGAFIKMYYGTIWRKFRMLFFIIGIMILLWVIYKDKSSWGNFEKIYSPEILNFGILLLLPVSDSIKTSNRFFVRIVTHISVISYSMYLINLAVVAEVIRDNFMPVGYFQSIVMFIIYWVVVIVLSTTIYKYYEKPLMDLRDKKFVRRRIFK
jgi:peptidoglycan/LPS O-acetylase OafA/YrhL